MAVKAIDKLQFLSFIFALLLSVTVHFTALRLGRTIMHQHTEIIWTYFSRILVCRCIIVLPSLSAVKCTVIDDKTANINGKNCSLSIVLTAMDQKLQKS